MFKRKRAIASLYRSNQAESREIARLGQELKMTYSAARETILSVLLIFHEITPHHEREPEYLNDRHQLLQEHLTDIENLLKRYRELQLLLPLH